MAVSSMTTSAAAVEAKKFELVSLEKHTFWFDLNNFFFTLHVISLIFSIHELLKFMDGKEQTSRRGNGE